MAGLDIGTSSIKFVIATINAEGLIEVAGVGCAPNSGVKQGVVVNIEMTTDAIRKAKEEAELMSGYIAHEVWVGVSGPHIKSFDSKGMVAIKNNEVSGAEANSALVRTFKWNEAGGQHISLINWFPFPAAVAMNQTAFGALPADLQKVITDQAVALPTFSISVVDGTANKVDIPTALCNAAIGPVKYHKVPDAVRKQMIKKSQGVIKSQIKDPEVRAIYNTIARLKSKFPTTDSDLPPATCLE